MSLTGGGAAYRDGQGRTRCRRCDKLVYAGEEEAQAAADAARAERVLLRAYREPACGYWHLTSRAELPFQAQQEERERERARAARGRGIQWILAALVAVIVVAVAVSAFVFDRLGGDDPAASPAATPVPTAAAVAVTGTPVPTPIPTATPAPAATATATPVATPPPTPVPTPEPIVLRSIGNTDGTGVALRDDCDDAARFSARGEGWAELTRVELIEEGEGRCAGWLHVESEGVASWVRSEYVISRVLSRTWSVGNTGGVGVARRGDCADAARISQPGEGWVDDTEVELLEAGEGRCAGWLRVESGGLESWVRERYLVEVIDIGSIGTWTVGNTGGGGVGLRDDCLDAARIGQGVSWPDTTRVELIEVGEDRCEGWLLVQSGGAESWVRERFLIPEQ